MSLLLWPTFPRFPFRANQLSFAGLDKLQTQVLLTTEGDVLVDVVCVRRGGHVAVVAVAACLLLLASQSPSPPPSAHTMVSTGFTLRASLSGTFLQTLLDLVTPLKGYSLSPRSCPVTRSAPSERFGY